MEFRFNKNTIDLYRAFLNPKIRTIISYGGTSSGKSISILQLLTIYALNRPVYNPITITIIAESYPVLRRGVIKDWKEIIMQDAFDNTKWNGGSSTYTFANKTIIQFVSGDNPDKFRGMRSNIVYFDEVSNIKKEAYKQLAMRTRYKIFASFNPSHEFFIKNEMAREDSFVLHSTYKDNNFVDLPIIKELEQRAKFDSNFKRVYVNGEWGTLEGNIFNEGTNYQIVSEYPFNGARVEKIFGLDWGFSNDPTSVIEVHYKRNVGSIRDEIWIKEHLYETGLINSEIADVLFKANPSNIKIVADSAAPKDIEDFKRTYRMQMIRAYKPPGSILSGINSLKEVMIFIDSNSLNTIKEFRNYSWASDKNGEQLQKPKDNFNHIIDALRYAFYEVKKERGRFSVELL